MLFRNNVNWDHALFRMRNLKMNIIRYWNLFRFNPAAEKKFVVDSKAPTKEFQEFIGGEVRYTSLALKDAEKAARLQAQAAENAKERYDYLQKLQVLYGDN